MAKKKQRLLASEIAEICRKRNERLEKKELQRLKRQAKLEKQIAETEATIAKLKGE